MDEAVGMESAARDDKFGFELAGGGLQRPGGALAAGVLEPGVEADFPAGLTDELAEFFADAG